jgi:hypothetical protein
MSGETWGCSECDAVWPIYRLTCACGNPRPREIGKKQRNGIYCRNCEDVIDFGEMKPFMRDDDVLDMLCPGCDETLVRGE